MWGVLGKELSLSFSVRPVFCLFLPHIHTREEERKTGEGVWARSWGEVMGGSYTVAGMGGLLRSGEV